MLIILQDSQDTAVRCFVEDGRDYASFLRFAETLCRSYGQAVDFVFKPHPREPGARVCGAQSLADTDIITALQDCDRVMTFSSGVGVMAMLVGRPVGFYGVPFYGDAPTCYRIKDASSFEAFLASEDSDPSVALPFLGHLARFYSDVTFFGRRFNALSRRDVACIYQTIRLFTDGVEHTAQVERGLASTAWSLVATPALRAMSNRLGLGYRSFP